MQDYQSLLLADTACGFLLIGGYKCTSLLRFPAGTIAAGVEGDPDPQEPIPQQPD
jgi:hypothetical protein